MDSKIIFLLALLCSSSALAKGKTNISNEIKYAVSYCLSKSYSGSSFSNDARYISGAYLQKGNYGLDMYESIRDSVDSLTKTKYVSKHDKNLDIMQCLDLSYSEKLASEINLIANNKPSWTGTL